jgi:PAS domain S-box-containing protein
MAENKTSRKIRSTSSTKRQSNKPREEIQRVRLDSILTMDETGRIHSVSDDIEGLLGWTPAELCGRNVKTLIPEPKRSALDRYLDRYRDPGKAEVLERSRRFDAVRKDGKIVPIELSVSRAVFPGHVGPYFIGLLRDKSGQIDVESDSPAVRTKLQRFVTEQTRALAASHLRLQLSDRLVTMGVLAAGLGHDLNNVLLPLRAQINAVEHAGVSEAAAEHLVEVRRALMYLQQLSNGLHVLSIDPREEDGGLDVAYSTDIHTWWAQVGTLLRSLLPRRIKLRCSLPKQLPNVGIAPHMLTQAVMNILANAGDAIPPGAVSGQVSLSARHDSEKRLVVLSIKDNGRGMTQAVKMRACDPFFTTKPRAVGTGLGLPIAKKAIERTGGRMEIHSAPEKGTTVSLNLPTSNSAAKWSNANGGTNGASNRGAGTRTGGPGHQSAEPHAAVEESKRLTMRAAVSLGKREEEAVVSQMLVGAGFKLVAAPAQMAGSADVWVTEATALSLKQASRWHAKNPARKVILLGLPAKREAPAWTALGALVVGTKEDLQTLRSQVLQVAAKLQDSFNKRG